MIFGNLHHWTRLDYDHLLDTPIFFFFFLEFQVDVSILQIGSARSHAALNKHLCGRQAAAAASAASSGNSAAAAAAATSASKSIALARYCFAVELLSELQ